MGREEAIDENGESNCGYAIRDPINPFLSETYILEKR